MRGAAVLRDRSRGAPRRSFDRPAQSGNLRRAGLDGAGHRTAARGGDHMTGKSKLRRAAIAALAGFLSLAPVQAAEITRILVGFPPGQATDIVARLVADRLGPML